MPFDGSESAVIGAGYVGIARAVGLAEPGGDILLVEQDPDGLTALADSRIRFYEPGLPAAGSCRVRRSPGIVMTSSLSASGRLSMTRAQGRLWSLCRLHFSSGLRSPWHLHERATLDLDYTDGWPLALDLRNLTPSVRAVMGGTG